MASGIELSPFSIDRVQNRSDGGWGSLVKNILIKIYLKFDYCMLGDLASHNHIYSE